MLPLIATPAEVDHSNTSVAGPPNHRAACVVVMHISSSAHTVCASPFSALLCVTNPQPTQTRQRDICLHMQNSVLALQRHAMHPVGRPRCCQAAAAACRPGPTAKAKAGRLASMQLIWTWAGIRFPLKPQEPLQPAEPQVCHMVPTCSATLQVLLTLTKQWLLALSPVFTCLTCTDSAYQSFTLSVCLHASTSSCM